MIEELSLTSNFVKSKILLDDIMDIIQISGLFSEAALITHADRTVISVTLRKGAEP